MPKYRKTWTKTLESFDFNEMPDDFCRVVWLLLPLILDSEGRGIDLPAWVCARMFPLRRVEESDVIRAFDFFESRGMIVRYEVDGRRYFYSTNWSTYQSGTEKESASVLPAPSEQLPTYSRPTPEQVKNKSGAAPAQVGVAESASASVNESVLTQNEIFRTYEREIGPLTPIIGDQLQAALVDYPEDWIVQAIRESALSNARNWKYTEAILKRWKVDGFQSQKKPSNGNGKLKPVSQVGTHQRGMKL